VCETHVHQLAGRINPVRKNSLKEGGRRQPSRVDHGKKKHLKQNTKGGRRKTDHYSCGEPFQKVCFFCTKKGKNLKKKGNKRQNISGVRSTKNITKTVRGQ